jgi:hypothetical protein
LHPAYDAHMGALCSTVLRKSPFRLWSISSRYVWVPRYLNRYHVRTYEGSNHPFLEVEESGESCILIDETRPDRES